MRVFATLILALLAGRPQAAPLRAGVMVASTGRGVLAMAGPVLPVGTTVTLVTIDEPQRVHSARVARRLPDSEVMAMHDTPGPYYEVVSEPGSDALPDFAVAVPGRPDVDRTATAVALRVGDAAVQVRVRGCTSSEGLHLTLWAGEPLRTERLWHAYFYLGYDVEPTCQPADVQQGG
jgi:hypothetical protein